MSPERAALVELLEVERYAPPPPPLAELELERREERQRQLRRRRGCIECRNAIGPGWLCTGCGRVL